MANIIILYIYSVEKAARKILKKPLEVVVGGKSIVASNIEQHVEVWEKDKKYPRLLELLGEWYEKGNVLIFINTQETADKLLTVRMKKDL